MTKKILSMRITAGQKVWAFDAADKEVAELQLSLLELWAERAQKLGFDVNGLVCELSPVDRWRIVWDAVGKRWTVEPA